METLPVEIVRLPVEQWPAYRELRLEALHESPQAFGSNYQDQQGRPDSFWQGRLVEAAKGEQNWLLFARAGNRLLGMIGAVREEQDGPLAVATIISVYVLPEARGRGVSHRLMQAILDTLKEAGIQKALLGVVAEQAAALHLYQHFGFTTYHSELHLMGDGVQRTELLMEKLI